MNIYRVSVKNKSYFLFYLQYLLKGFPSEQKKLLEMREKLDIFQTVRWHESWKETVLPLLLNDKEKLH